MALADYLRRYTPRSVRNWARSPRKSARYVWDCANFACGITPKLEVRNEFFVSCHPLSRREFEVFRTDPEQVAELDGFIYHCEPGMRFVDVGAHHGLFTLVALHYGGPSAVALAVDASRRVTDVLRANLRLNHPRSPRHSILNVAAAGCDGTLRMLTAGPFSADYMTPTLSSRADGTSVPAMALSSIFATCAWRPTHLKLDIEGCELEVVRSSLTLLEELRPILFLELHGSMIEARGGDPSRVVDDLRKCGYSRFEIGGEAIDESAMAKRGYNCRMVCLVRDV